MSDVALPEPMLAEPPRRDAWIVWTALASVLLHGGVLAFLFWQPLPRSAEAPPPPAIDVELVTPPEPSDPAPEEDPIEKPATEPAEVTEPTVEPSTPETPPEAEVAKTEPEAPAAAPAAAPSGAEAATSAAAEPSQGIIDPSKVAPTPLSRPVRGLTAQPGTPAEDATAPSDAADTAEGAVAAAPSAEPDVATLELGEPRNAERFYLEAMLSAPSMAAARDMIRTLPRDKRLAQTCNLEALAQIGNAGEDFAPDVVMAEAYALAEVTDTRLVANGAIFRSRDKWYGFAFDCALSDDLSAVTGFSYRLGADVTDAVLARLNRN